MSLGEFLEPERHEFALDPDSEAFEGRLGRAFVNHGAEAFVLKLRPHPRLSNSAP